MGAWLSEQCSMIRSAVRRERTATTRLLTDKALAFVAEHYGESDLSIDRVCGHLGVSAAYFYSLFKKEMGMSFVAYLTKVRMEQALHLLDTTEEKSYAIAGMVGYEEPNYFSYVFKSSMGFHRPSTGRVREKEKMVRNKVKRDFYIFVICPKQSTGEGISSSLPLCLLRWLH